MVKRRRKKKVSISNHILIPKHSKLSQKDKKELLERYDITENELPKILASDAGLLKVSAKPGDVIKIERKSKTAGYSKFYRVVING